jgi:protein-L-isoaspartate(D-aspartate) O-methyltransferase
MAKDPTLHDRRSMVERQIAARGIDDERVLHAMAEVPREQFVPEKWAHAAHEDTALPIAEGQTISQPFIVAYMAQAAELGPHDRVLEIGTGSGYAAAVFSRLATEVYTIERHAGLAAGAERVFERLGYKNIHVAVRDGTLGWPEHAPFDAIIVAAGGPGQIPQALLGQLARGGRLVIPRGETQSEQELVRVRRGDDGKLGAEEHLGGVRFVPLVGAEGWDGHQDRDRSA